MQGKVKRSQLLIAYAEATDPAERKRLLAQWLHAGGRELIDQATRAGAASLKTRQAND
jgi:hypothetical protein